MCSVRIDQAFICYNTCEIDLPQDQIWYWASYPTAQDLRKSDNSHAVMEAARRVPLDNFDRPPFSKTKLYVACRECRDVSGGVLKTLIFKLNDN